MIPGRLRTYRELTEGIAEDWRVWWAWEREMEATAKPRTRALRRHHRQRMIDRARRIMRQTWYWSQSENVDEEIADLAPRFADNMAKCSCPTCGNPRRWYGKPTVQERRLGGGVDTI